jgi:hypothetical protein
MKEEKTEEAVSEFTYEERANTGKCRHEYVPTVANDGWKTYLCIKCGHGYGEKQEQ